MVQRAAHVKMPVTHGSRVATNIGTVGGGIVGGVVGAGGAGAISAGTASIPGGIAGACTGSSLGGSAGKVVDAALVGDSVRGQIIDGAPSVRVGEEREKAANADPARREAGCDNAPIAEGAEKVYVEGWNFSRKEDRTECGGKIADGCPTVWVGGRPTRAGKYIRDEGTLLDMAIDLGGQGLCTASATGIINKGLGAAGMVATATGQEDVSDAIGLAKTGRGLSNPQSTLDVIDNVAGGGHNTKGFWDRWFGSN